MRWFGHRTRKPLKASVRWDFFEHVLLAEDPRVYPKHAWVAWNT